MDRASTQHHAHSQLNASRPPQLLGIARCCWEGEYPPTDLTTASNPLPSPEVPHYVDRMLAWMQQVQKQLTPKEAPHHTNPYQVRDAIWVATIPLERTSKLSLKWSGPYIVTDTPNLYQVEYCTAVGKRMVHINHAKPSTLAPSPPPRHPSLTQTLPTLGIHPSSQAHRLGCILFLPLPRFSVSPEPFDFPCYLKFPLLWHFPYLKPSDYLCCTGFPLLRWPPLPGSPDSPCHFSYPFR